MRVAIIGYGIDGQAAARYYAARGDQITVCDRNAELKIPSEYHSQLGADYLQELDQYDLIVRSPGTPRRLIATTAKVSSPTIEFFNRCPAPIIGVTGTKGKSTTSSLIWHILCTAGQRAWLAGNIGTPVLDILPKVSAGDWAVVELSSFQLEDMQQSPHVGVLLHISPDHLDYHDGFEEYVATKGVIFRYQTGKDIAIFRAGDSVVEQLAATSPARTKLPFSVEQPQLTGAYLKRDGSDEAIYFQQTRICAAAEVPLLGRHNLENVCAAVAATYPIVQDAASVRQAIMSFTSLPHRLQLVGEINGVRYIDDSISTNPETAIAAIQSFAEPKVMMLGGSDKGLKFDELARAVAADQVRYVVLTGQTADAIAAELKQAGYHDFVIEQGNMGAIVCQAAAHAQSGDVVLLSPACASFGVFKDYKDRGEQFARAVQQLKS